MFAFLSALRKHTRPALALATASVIAGCDAMPVSNIGTGAPTGLFSRTVDIALLVPQSDASAAPVAVGLENAARLALADLADAGSVTLTVYDTAGSAQTAAQQAQIAVDAGADVILGPLFGEAANAAGLAVADEGVPVLSFSNNPEIAGGNVFVLGRTYADVADRLMGYAHDQGRQRVLAIYPEGISGQFGRLAIEQAAAMHGLGMVTSEGYALSVEGVTRTAQAAGSTLDAGVDTVFITTDATNAAMPMLLTMLPENGLTPDAVQYIALTRLDVRPDLFDLPAAEGTWFTQPDDLASQSFRDRYASTYDNLPHPLAGLAYDGVAAIAALRASGEAVTPQNLTRPQGFEGSGGVFRFKADGSNQRALAIATVRDKQVITLEPAPASFPTSIMAGF